MMVQSILHCGTCLMWSALLFFMIIYTFGIFLASSVTDYVRENSSDTYYSSYKKQWHSLPRSLWTLFSCMTGGVSWGEVSEPLIHMGWIYGVSMGFFMFFIIFVATNIITGIFVDQALQSAKNDREEMIQEQLHDRDDSRSELQKIFEAADTDKSGSLTQSEFELHLKSEKVRAHLDFMGIQINEAIGLFRILDVDNSNSVEIDEFLFGCMRLKGGASSIDLATLMYEQKRVIQGLRKFQKDIIGSLEDLHEKFNQCAILGN